MFQKLNFPDYQFNIQKMNDTVMIFDRVRKKFVKLTPEEWVRQHILQYLIDSCSLPATRISVEKQLKIHGMLKRFDAVIIGKSAQPIMLIECKAPTISIDNKVFEQAVRYNLSLKVPFLLLTNGLRHMTIECDHDLNSCRHIGDLPRTDILK